MIVGGNTWEWVQRGMESDKAETRKRDNFLRSLALKEKSDGGLREMSVEFFLFFAFYLLKEQDPLSRTIFHGQNLADYIPVVWVSMSSLVCFLEIDI